MRYRYEGLGRGRKRLMPYLRIANCTFGLIRLQDIISPGQNALRFGQKKCSRPECLTKRRKAKIQFSKNKMSWNFQICAFLCASPTVGYSLRDIISSKFYTVFFDTAPTKRHKEVEATDSFTILSTYNAPSWTEHNLVTERDRGLSAKRRGRPRLDGDMQ